MGLPASTLHSFEPIVVSCEANATKPAVALFHRAAAELSLEPGAILHVGDSLEMEVNGALGAGCQGVLLDRRGPARAPRQIQSLHELAGLLGPR